MNINLYEATGNWNNGTDKVLNSILFLIDKDLYPFLTPFLDQNWSIWSEFIPDGDYITWS